MVDGNTVKVTVSYMEIIYGDAEMLNEIKETDYVFKTTDGFESNLSTLVYDYIFLGSTLNEAEKYISGN